jgi:hypothetical protein
MMSGVSKGATSPQATYLVGQQESMIALLFMPILNHQRDPTHQSTHQYMEDNPFNQR